MPADKQKLMLRGKMIKDDTNWEEVKTLSNNCTFILMGTAETEHINFKKEINNTTNSTTDITVNVNETADIRNPIGLSNLGNTC